MRKQYDILFLNGTVVDPMNGILGKFDLAVRNGRIEECARQLDRSRSDQVIDAQGKLVIPGVVDSHAHLVRPGSEGAAYGMLLKAGVTTAACFAGPVQTVKKEILEKGSGLNVLVLEALHSGNGFSSPGPSKTEVRQAVGKALDDGAFGVKILGGHYPLTPETIEAIIGEASEQKCYVGAHAGSTTKGSNIEGMEQVVDLAQGLPLHLAHINAYCRGMVEPIPAELSRAFRKLLESPNIISESHLAVNNSTSADLDEDGLPKSHVTRACLRMGGYPEDGKGLEEALKAAYAKIYALVGDEMDYLSVSEGLDYWKANKTGVKCSFPVNMPASLAACAVSKDERGRFIIPAISSDGGGIPRNIILKNGIMLTRMGYLTLKELVEKISLAPAKMFGLAGKGHFTPGADADITIADPCSGEAEVAVTAGKVRMARGIVFGGSGVLLTGERGASRLKAEGIPHETVFLDNSMFLTGR